MKFTLFGNVTLDENTHGKRTSSGSGGSVYYIAKFLHGLDQDVSVVTTYGVDFPIDNMPDVDFYPKRADKSKTLKFHNVYVNDRRRQYVSDHDKQDIRFGMREYFRNEKKSDCTLICPLLPNLSLTDIKIILKKVVSTTNILLAQGFFRSVQESGHVTQREWKNSKETASLFDVIILSDQDIYGYLDYVNNWKEHSIVIVTKGNKGSILYDKNEIYEPPAYRQSEIFDETGAGDIFAAGFAYKFVKSRDPIQACDFANASASISLRLGKDKLKYREEDIIKLQQSKK